MLKATALVALSTVTFLASGATTAYVRFQSNIDGADVEHLLGDDRPEAPLPDPDDPNAGSPLNILVMGTDIRDETGIADDGTEGARSDTTIVVHISADRQRVELVSIPRDSLVDIPDCMREDGSTSRPRPGTMFNAAFEIGAQSGLTSDGAACTQRTVEQNTGLYINDFVVVNMAGFATMVDALGGVPICIPQEIYSPKADHLHLQAGNQVLTGEIAAKYVRARTGQGLGNGSDIDRISRQQEFLAAMAREALGKNILTDVPELIRFLNAVTRSLTISSGLSSIPDMTGLAFSLRNLPSGNIVFMTIPFAAAPSDPNRVVWTPEAATVWADLAADRPVVPPAAGADATAGDSDAGGVGGTTGSPPDAATSGAGADDSGTAPPPQAVTETDDVTTVSTAGATPAAEPTKEPVVDTITPDDLTPVCG